MRMIKPGTSMPPKTTKPRVAPKPRIAPKPRKGAPLGGSITPLPQAPINLNPKPRKGGPMPVPQLGQEMGQDKLHHARKNQQAAQLKQQKQKANATPVGKGQKIVGRAAGKNPSAAMQMPRNIKGMR